jgi:uncharacterized protein
VHDTAARGALAWRVDRKTPGQEPTMGSISNRSFAVVTGGSSGIGLELAKQLIEHDFDVLIAGDRDVEEARTQLAAYDGANIYGLEIDLSRPEGVEELVREVLAMARPIEALVLNAGVGVGGEFLKTELDREIEMIELNCTAVVRLAKALVPQMVARGQGHVLITSSIAGVMPAPYEAVYGATKAFDLSFAEGLRDELRDTGVTVTALQPGPTDTHFFERADLEDTKVGAGKKDDPALVAKQGFDAMMRGDDKVYAGSIGTRMKGLASEILPETTKARQHRKQAEPGSGHKK